MPTRTTIRRTPHISAVHPVTNEKYVCRVLSHRRSGAIRIEMLADSSIGAGKTFVLQRSRPGYADLILACDSLLQASRPHPGDAHLDKGRQRVQWNPNSPDYTLRSTHAYTLIGFLPRLINPKPGRPIQSDFAALSAEAPPTGIHPTTHGARTARRGEILLTTSKMMTLCQDIIERTSDLRRMKGYSSIEARKINAMTMQVNAALETLRRAVFEGKLIDPPTAEPVAPAWGNPQPHDVPVDVDMSRMFEDEE